MRTIGIYDVDPDFRRDPKTDVFCWRCQKDLKPGQSRKWVHIINGGTDLLHPDDEDQYDAIANAATDLGCFPVGMDCARKIGEFAFSSPALDKIGADTPQADLNRNPPQE